MSSCPTIRRYQGTKSQVILEQIDSKIKESMKKELPRVSKDERLLALLKQKKEFEKATEKAKKDFDDYCNELGIVYSDYHGKDEFSICYECLVPNDVVTVLQHASDLHCIGRKKDANDIWEKLIKKYRLCE